MRVKKAPIAILSRVRILSDFFCVLGVLPNAITLFEQKWVKSGKNSTKRGKEGVEPVKESETET